MFGLFWEMHQARRIADAEATAQATRSSVERTEDAARELEARIDRMMLANMAMWSLLKEKLGVTDEELAKRMEQIDLTDGKLDGKVRHTVRECPQCGRTMTLRHQRCLYCGFTPPADELAVFEARPGAAQAEAATAATLYDGSAEEHPAISRDQWPKP